MFCFPRFYAIFARFLADFVDWNVEKRQQGNNISQSAFLKSLLQFSQQKLSQIGTENDKKPIFFQS